MEAADWEPRVAIAISLVSLGVSIWTMWANRRRLDLYELHVKLLRLTKAALDHLRVQADQYPTEEDVRELRKDAVFAAKRARWKDVRVAADRVLEACDAVLVPRVREAPLEQRDEIRQAIEEALDAASETIGARVDATSIRGRWRRARSSG